MLVAKRSRGERGRSVRGLVAAAATALVVAVGMPATAGAVPPPPPNPSDSELEQSREREREHAGEVGELTNELAEAEDRLSQARAEVARKEELVNKAQVDLASAEEAAAEAERAAERAQRDSERAAEDLEAARQRADEFISGSYQQGSTVGSVTAYVGSSSREELLAREQLLGAMGDSEGEALEGVRAARVDKSNADAAAREAAEIAEQRQREAEEAAHAAEAAYEDAVEARSSQAERTERLEAERDEVAERLYEAQSRVSDLEGQRQRYEDWREEKRREEEKQAQQAALAAAESSGSSGGQAQQAQSSNVSVETVVQRAKSQLGVPYAWGGGNTQGPTRGVRDGGVADAHGDYKKIGFDCSGLMVYAFAPHRTLAKYSGYQYDEGRKVPLSQKRRGDLLFWGTQGIHHVAMYLGNGQMIEAPQSGGHVRIVPVRYGDILPYATRVIE
ncbi:Cell wall-associated hydrolase, NlpC family [Haloechinothrix alba]|uniref:Cell wall-associated hydrolase, NlpC family n=1 Tax=Haloechinothrix alba TaxID=664784 RepID=A0A238X8I7_9PSEU|nr:NlpC/P60 family protein [Haloechinothrix alba]SNR55020.1 Cell wall-associated hydrolase, NlpC family [Haloechinothrix alba]